MVANFNEPLPALFRVGVDVVVNEFAAKLKGVIAVHNRIVIQQLQVAVRP